MTTTQQGQPTPVTRREFVKTGAAAAAGAAMASTLWAPKTAWAGGSDALKIGLVGCGGRGSGAAVQALRAHSGNVLTAMADIFPERIENSLNGIREAVGDEASRQVTVDAEHQFVGFDSYQKLIDSGVDVVLLATPPGFRPAQIEAAVKAGRHIFAEKPMAVDAPGVRQVLAAAEQAKKQKTAIVAGFCWRYGDGEQAAFAEINSGRIGEVVSVHTTYHAGTLGKSVRQPDWTDMEWQLRNWWHFCWLSGDHIVEQACHAIDRLNWALNNEMPERATALGGRAARQGAESGDVFDHFAVVYEYSRGRRAFHTCRQIDNTPGDNADYIQGSKGRAVVNGWTRTYDLRNLDGEQVWTIDIPAGNTAKMYQNEHDALFESIRSGTPINDGVWMCNSTMMAIMGRMAAYTGQTLTWEQALNSQERLGPETLEWGVLETRPVPVPGVTKFF